MSSASQLRRASAPRHANRRRRLFVTGLVAALTAGCVTVPPRISVSPLTVETLPAVLAARTGAPVMPGNRVEMLADETVFPVMGAAIARARHTITIAQYTYHPGPLADVLTEALAERARAGVAVKMLLDGFGSLGLPRRYAERLREAGVQVVFFRPLGRPANLNHRNHRRIVVLDGRVGFTGGAGIGSRYAGNGRLDGHWHSMSVRVEGPVVAELQRAFAEDWREATGEQLDGHGFFPPLTARGQVPAQILLTSPWAGRFDGYTLFRLAVAAARRTIYVTNPYFLPDAALEDAFRDALARGVRVVILGSGPTRWNPVRTLSRGRLGRLLADRAEVYEYLPAMLHVKALMVDGAWSAVGSSNIDNRSFALNAELDLAIAGRGVTADLERLFREDLRWARRLDEARWRERPLSDRLLELLARPLWYLL